jgi:peptide-methionine (R)-S-oxide reductase
MVLWAVALGGIALQCTRSDASNQKAEGGRMPAATVKIYSVERGGFVMVEKVVKTEEEWKKLLTPEQFRVTRQKATELACSGPYWNHHQDGVYQCICCGTDLFDSKTKFESGTGWPSYFAPVAKENLRLERDTSFLMERTEVLCARCDAHLGHVFDDGPEPTGQRYCMNSVALRFVAR